jgi:hypothetical protein
MLSTSTALSWLCRRCTFTTLMGRGTNTAPGMDWVHCMAHKLHLAVKAALGLDEK